MPKVSVIIPCFNQGQYIDEAVDSVLNQTLQDFEIIIVNDGSTDQFTNEKLLDYNKPKCKVIHTENKGLPTARNYGIYVSTGIYILPLDADDKIGSDYLEEASEILDNRSEIGIVYCNAEFFDEMAGRWSLPEFSEGNILAMNCIFCSAMFRKSDYLETRGYNPNMIYGWEDWDLWLSFIEKGKGVYKLPGVYFFYRIKKNGSMVNTLNSNFEKQRYSLNRIYLNHIDFYFNRLGNPIEQYSKIQDLQISLDNILASKDYEIGKLVLRPFRSLRSIIRNVFKFSH